jgi:hypothetical protein
MVVEEAEPVELGAGNGARGTVDLAGFLRSLSLMYL